MTSLWKTLNTPIGTLLRHAVSRFMGVRVLRTFEAGGIGRLLSDWVATTINADDDIRNNIAKIRARAQDLEKNSPYGKRYLRLLETEVIGEQGVKMQSRAVTTLNSQKPELDQRASRIIERGWRKWGKKGICDITGKFSWRQIEQLALRLTARDGDCLVEIRRFYEQNEYHIGIKLIEGQYLDHQLNITKLANGNCIRMGVELDPDGRPVAYHICTKSPGVGDRCSIDSSHQRLPANSDTTRTIHLMDPFSPSDTRSVSWLHNVMTTLRQLEQSAEAELVAARAEACKFWSLEDQTGNLKASAANDRKNRTQKKLEKASPGQIFRTPSGKTLKQIDPNHPNGNFNGFYNTILHTIAAGLMVSFSSLAGDLSKINLSSIRAGVLLERSYYRLLQVWIIESLHETVFDEWLNMSLAVGALPGLRASEIERLDQAEWIPKRWPWIDPLKDVKAWILKRKMGWASDAMAIASEGNDFESVREQIKRNEDYDEKLYGEEDKFSIQDVRLLDDMEPDELREMIEEYIQENHAA